jgi:hypothetical protein
MVKETVINLNELAHSDPVLCLAFGLMAWEYWPSKERELNSSFYSVIN